MSVLSSVDGVAKANAWDEYYPDTGCEESPKCVECPLPLCKYEKAYRDMVKRQKDETVKELALEGFGENEIARRVKVGKYRVQRILSRMRGNGRPGRPRKHAESAGLRR